MKQKDFSERFSKGQLAVGLCVIVGCLLWGHHLHGQADKLAFSLLFGFSVGYILSRSRFGFAGGIKRIYVRGEGSLSRGVLISMAALTMLYGSMQWAAASKGGVVSYLVKEGDKLIPGTQNVHWITLALMVGAFLFGIGMIIAGGCASGTLSDLGEGESHALIALPFFILASLPGEYVRVLFEGTAFSKSLAWRVYLPDYFGYFGAMAVSLLGFLLLYICVVRYENLRKKEGTYLSPLSDYQDFENTLKEDEKPTTFWGVYHTLFVKRWNFATGGLLLAIASAAYMAFGGKAWGVTTAFSKIDMWLFNQVGIQLHHPGLKSIQSAVDKGLLQDAGVILDIGIVLGALVAFLLAGRFRFNIEVHGKNVPLYILGGLLMGFGARLAHGCNIGALYSSVPNLSLAGWVFMLFISLGAVAGLKLFAGGKSCLVPARHRDKKDFS